MSDLVDYRRLVYTAMCGVVREALGFFSKSSTSGDVHVAISFLTGCSGVVLPAYLKAQYPESMTIVLQYQFRDLSVSSSDFSVVLSFRGKEERITVSFKAIVKYVDMIANFSLDLEQYGDVELGVDYDSDNDDGVVTAEDDATTEVPSGTTTQNNIIFIDRFLKS